LLVNFREILVVRQATMVLLAAALCSGFAPADKPGDRPAVEGQTTLTSVVAGLPAPNWQLSSRDVKFESAAAWSIKRFALHGGTQEGSELLVLDNGKLQITVIPTRGMSILEVRCGDVRLGWNSPVKQVVHPQFIRLESRGGLGWLEGFNEWMVHCGLEWAGHPGKDEFVNNVGEKATMDLTLHGKIGNIPASEVSVTVDPDSPHRIHIKGVVHEQAFYGPKLELDTEISTLPGSSAFRIDDHVVNHGAFAQEFELLYHCNFGAPLLEKGSHVLTAARSIAPFNEHAAEGLSHWNTYDGPTPGFIEQVFCLEPLAGAEGHAQVMLENASRDRAVSMRWKPAELPHLTIWKNTAAIEDGYVTGLEPGTNFAYNRRLERLAGRVPKLAPQQERRFTIDVGIQIGQAEVANQAAEIVKLQSSQPLRTSAKPPLAADPAAP
jgi:hypothetical protein